MRHLTRLTLLLAFLLSFGQAWSQCTANFSVSTSALTAVFTNTSTGSAVNAYWNFGDGGVSYDYNPTYTYSSAGTYTVCLYMYTSTWILCGTYCDTITVAPTCTSGFTFSMVGGAVTFTNTSTGAVDSVWWDFGDGATSDSLSPHHTYTTPGWYYVCMTPYDSTGAACSMSWCEYVNISSLAGCVSSFTYSMSSATTADFVSTSTGPWATLYWDFGDGGTSTDPNPSHTYSTAGSFYVCLYAYDSLGNNCDMGFCDYITIPTSSTGCSSGFTYTTIGDTVFFTNGSFLSSSFYWDFGDGTTSTDANPAHAFPFTGWFYVCLTALDPAGIPCDFGYCEYIYATGTGSTCEASFTTTASTFTGIFDNTSTGTTIWYYVWDFGDGATSSSTSPTHTYTTAGTYLVCLTVYDWYGYVCDSACNYITVGPVAPDCWSFFSFTNSGTTVDFTNESVGYTSAVSWTFGDGGTSTAMDPTHTYASPGWYYVCINAIDSLGAPCDSGYCDWIFIDGCATSFSYSNTGTLVTFYNTSYGALNASWDFGDGSPVSTDWAPSHNYPGPGIYNACLTTTDSSGATCGTYCLNVDLGALPSCGAAFSAYDSSAHKVFVSSSSGSSPISTYLWDFGDGSTSIMARPVHRYLVPGTYTVCLTITTLDGCTDTQCNTITVLVGTDDPSAWSPSVTAWPNPTNGTVWLAYELPIASDAVLEVFDLVGHRVATVSNGFAAAGRREMEWDASALPSGVYLVRLTTDAGQATLKLVRE